MVIIREHSIVESLALHQPGQARPDLFLATQIEMACFTFLDKDTLPIGRLHIGGSRRKLVSESGALTLNREREGDHEADASHKNILSVQPTRLLFMRLQENGGDEGQNACIQASLGLSTAS